jgi:hypothetical protein
MTDLPLHIRSPELYFKYVLRCAILLLLCFRLSQHDSTVMLRSQARGENISLCFVGFGSLLTDNILCTPEVAIQYTMEWY